MQTRAHGVPSISYPPEAAPSHRPIPLLDLTSPISRHCEDRLDIATRTLQSCSIDGTEPLTEGWRRAEIPAAGGVGNARSVARIHSAVACGGSLDGVRLLSEAGVRRILEEQTNGEDRVLAMPIRFGMGFGLIGPEFPLSPSQRAFFWGGWGGSIAVIDLEARMSVAYVMNRMAPDMLGDLRGGSVVLSVYKALGA